MVEQSFETKTLEQLKKMLMLDDVRIKDNIFNTRKVFANGKLAFKFRSSSYEYYIPSANGEYMWGPFELKSLYVDGKKMSFGADKIMELYNFSEKVRIAQLNKHYKSFLSGILNSAKQKVK